MIVITYRMPDGSPGKFETQSMVAALTKIDEIENTGAYALVKVEKDGVEVKR